MRKTISVAVPADVPLPALVAQLAELGLEPHGGGGALTFRRGPVSAVSSNTVESAGLDCSAAFRRAQLRAELASVRRMEETALESVAHYARTHQYGAAAEAETDLHDIRAHAAGLRAKLEALEVDDV